MPNISFEVFSSLEWLKSAFLWWSTPHDHEACESSPPEKPTPEKLSNMKTVRLKIEHPNSGSPQRVGRINTALVDASNDREIERQIEHDEAAAALDAAKFARRVRRRLGFSQAEFATRIDVSLETIRNWEQGKRCPTGAAKALLKILDKAPEAALAALH